MIWMNDLMIFGKGYLGTRLSEAYGCRVVSRHELELTNLPEVRNYLDLCRPGVIINAAGVTSGPGETGVDWCETHIPETIAGNVSAAVNLSTAAAERKIYFVHLGSGCVYDGNKDGAGFSEKDAPNFYGRQVYADSKIDAERVLRKLPGLLLRIRMPIDDRPHARNLIDKLAGYRRVIAVQNSMTTVPDMVSAIKSLIERRRHGIYHLTNPGTISAREIMEMYREIAEPNHDFGLMSLEELDKITKAKRSNCILDSSKLREEGIKMPEIHEAVERYLLRYKEFKES